MPVPTVDSTGAWRALERSAVFDCFPELIGFGSTTGCLDFHKEECHVCTVLQQYTRLSRKLSVLTGQILSKRMFLPIIWTPEDLLNQSVPFGLEHDKKNNNTNNMRVVCV